MSRTPAAPVPGRLLPFGMLAFVLVLFLPPALAAQDAEPLRVFISVDMEGLGGVGTPDMVRAGGQDYALGRRLATDEVNAVVEAVFETGPAHILVNDSHGSMQNLLHTELDPRVEYIQGAIKPFGMVEGLDGSFDAVIFLGYHSRAGTRQGFLAHTGSGAVQGLWINGMEVGEGEWNALFAGGFGVPVVLASGDQAFVDQFSESVRTETVVTKTAVTPRSARLRHPEQVTRELREATRRGLAARETIEPLRTANPIEVRIRFDEPTRPQIVTAIPGVRQVDGYTVEFTVETMVEAYPLIRLLYRFVGI
jgi:D-amino peptidase